jgi:hypothetical protein
MLSSYIKQASGDTGTVPVDKRTQQHEATKYDAVSASRSILSSYLSIASDTGTVKKQVGVPVDHTVITKGGDRTGAHNSFSRGGGTGWRNFVGAFDDDEFVNTAPVAGAQNVRKSSHAIEHSSRDNDASSPSSQLFRMPEPLYSPLSPTSNQPLRLHVGELDEPSATKQLSSSIGMFHSSIKAADAQFSSKRVSFEPLQHAPPPQDSAIIMATEHLQDRVQQLTKKCDDTEDAMRGLIQAHAVEISLIRAEVDMVTSENSRLRLEVAQLQASSHAFVCILLPSHYPCSVATPNLRVRAIPYATSTTDCSCSLWNSPIILKAVMLLLQTLDLSWSKYTGHSPPQFLHASPLFACNSSLISSAEVA